MSLLLLHKFNYHLSGFLCNQSWLGLAWLVGSHQTMSRTAERAVVWESTRLHPLTWWLALVSKPEFQHEKAKSFDELSLPWIAYRFNFNKPKFPAFQSTIAHSKITARQHKVIQADKWHLINIQHVGQSVTWSVHKCELCACLFDGCRQSRDAV